MLCFYYAAAIMKDDELKIDAIKIHAMPCHVAAELFHAYAADDYYYAAFCHDAKDAEAACCQQSAFLCERCFLLL